MLLSLWQAEPRPLLARARSVATPVHARGCDGCVDGSSDGFMLGPYVGSFVGPAVLGL